VHSVHCEVGRQMKLTQNCVQ